MNHAYTSDRVTRRSVLSLTLGAALLVATVPARAQEGIEIPAPTLAPPTEDLGVALLAGGCFWGVQGVFQHVDGVLSAVSGYAGGDAHNAHYDSVVSGTTGHAETVKVTYDPAKISYGEILEIFFSVVHDPTQLNRQGPDIGPHYRSAIFPLDAAQAEFARAYIAELNAARVFDAAIVTKLEPDRPFYPAEEYHQDFMVKNPTHPYIVYHDVPKVSNLQRLFRTRYRQDPVLVAETAAWD